MGFFLHYFLRVPKLFSNPINVIDNDGFSMLLYILKLPNGIDDNGCLKYIRIQF